MTPLLKTLTEIASPSGHEDAIREAVLNLVKPHADEVRVDALPGLVVETRAWSWLAPFPLLVGLMTLSLCAFLAAVYMTVETDGTLQDDFRVRALGAGVLVGAVALPAALVARDQAPTIGIPLLASDWSLPFHAITGIVALWALVALVRRRFQLARMLAIGQTALILIGWGMAQYPYVLAPDLDLVQSAAPAIVLSGTLIVLGVGSVLLVPAFFWLYRVFKQN